jgi:GNAT superfamily N-acetyltransferase
MSAQVSIRRADPHEGERLREIAEASKRHWGYDPDWVREWAATGDFSPAALRAKEVYVAETDGRAVAFVALLAKGETVLLDDLWVEPPWIGKGIGSRLFRFAVERARQLGAENLEWEAEPHAVGFYEKLGGAWLRDNEPNAWGRVVPVMGLTLPPESEAR